MFVLKKRTRDEAFAFIADRITTLLSTVVRASELWYISGMRDTNQLDEFC